MLSTIVTIAKNEGPYIWEWVAHHKMIGFDNIIMFQNDSDDLTHEIMSALRAAGVIKYFYNRAETGRHQTAAYQRSTRQEEYRSADWVMALDMDEFLVINTGDGTLNALYDAMPEFDCALINWKLFGSSGLVAMSDQPVTHRFVLAEEDDGIKRSRRPFKCLFRPSLFKRPGIHRAVGFDENDPQVKYVNGSGMPSSEFEILNFQCGDPRGRSLAQINHYIVKDPQSFVLKHARGSAHQSFRAIDAGYWKKRNRNREKDTGLLARGDALRAKMDELDQLTGGKLSQYTSESLQRHRDKFQQIVKDEGPRSLYHYCLENPNLDDAAPPWMSAQTPDAAG